MTFLVLASQGFKLLLGFSVNLLPFTANGCGHGLEANFTMGSSGLAFCSNGEHVQEDLTLMLEEEIIRGQRALGTVDIVVFGCGTLLRSVTLGWCLHGEGFNWNWRRHGVVIDGVVVVAVKLK